MRSLSRFLALGGAEKLFLLRCLATVAAVRIGLSLKRHNWMRRHIGGLQARSPASLHELRRVSWGVSAAARLVPGATCLTQAMAGQYLLASRGMESMVRIGVERNGGPQLKAHAWLISGDRVVLGGKSESFGNFAHLIDYGG